MNDIFAASFANGSRITIAAGHIPASDPAFRIDYWSGFPDSLIAIVFRRAFGSRRRQFWADYITSTD